MPSNLIITAPVGVMPASLSAQFSFDLRLEALDNRYPDGSSDRAALATIPRRFFTLSKRLTSQQWQDLRVFYFAHIGKPFYFYVGRETVPQWQPDPTGAATDGRYAVVFDSAWNETVGLGRSGADFLLREVADGG